MDRYTQIILSSLALWGGRYAVEFGDTLYEVWHGRRSGKTFRRDVDQLLQGLAVLGMRRLRVSDLGGSAEAKTVRELIDLLCEPSPSIAVKREAAAAGSTTAVGSGFGYFVLGLGIGAAAGILWARRSGEETRQLLADKAGEGTDYLKARREEGKEYLPQRSDELKGSSASDLSEKGKSTVSRHKDNLNAAVEAGKQAYRDALSDIKPTGATSAVHAAEEVAHHEWGKRQRLESGEHADEIVSDAFILGPATSSLEPPAQPASEVGASAHETNTSGDRSVREVVVTGQTLEGSEVLHFETDREYRLVFQVGAQRSGNLASGNRTIRDVPESGLRTHWVVTSSNVQFVAEISSAMVQRIGDGWVAEFDILIPASGESPSHTLGVRPDAGSRNLTVSIYATAAPGERELYRELSVTLEGAPKISKDEVCKAADQLHLGTSHEWTTPAAHIQISIVNGIAVVSSLKLAAKIYNFFESFSATDTLIGGNINNVRSSLETLREAHTDYLDNLDSGDLTARLAQGSWRPYSGSLEGWIPLPDEADETHKEGFEPVRSSAEFQALASDGYSLFDACFPQGTQLRALIEELPPGSRIDFHWTAQSGPGFVSHVPWALMYMAPVEVTGSSTPDPLNFLGLRFRIGTRSWAVSNASVAVGGLNSTYSIALMYWGDRENDDTAREAQWQTREFKAWTWLKLLPDRAAPDRKRQVVRALDQPEPVPAGVLYFYCQCSVGDGSQPCLRFGNTSRAEDTLKRVELSRSALKDGPLVFANACTTSQADPHMTSELEQAFFSRGIRAFIGTETKVPIALASKFAWLFFQFLYRRADSAPMCAGEALTQARMFLWTQYRNIGGLFYSITNQYDLYLASAEEVSSLAGR